MPNVKQIIDEHNKVILKKAAEPEKNVTALQTRGSGKIRDPRNEVGSRQATFIAYPALKSFHITHTTSILSAIPPLKIRGFS